MDIEKYHQIRITSRSSRSAWIEIASWLTPARFIPVALLAERVD